MALSKMNFCRMLSSLLIKIAAIVSFCAVIIACKNQDTPEWTNSLSMDLIPIPSMQNIYVSRCEISIGQFSKVMGYIPSELEGKPDTDPITYVTSQEAMQYCRLLTESEQNSGFITASAKYMLPSYKEWVSFAKGTPIKNSVTPEGGLGGNHLDGPLPICSGAPNRYGLYNIRGNVREWSRDPFQSYGTKMILGAHYTEYREGFLKVNNKAGSSEDLFEDKATGFRCVLHANQSDILVP